MVELAAAHKGTYLGDNYNDVPSSFQRSRELTVRIEEIEAALNQLERKQETLTAELAAEQKRLAARSSTRLAAPIDGNLWTVQAASGEYVRKGQELFTVLDCSTVVVTASVSERDYNQLRLGDPVRFRVSGSNREYNGTISKLGLTSTGRIDLFAATIAAQYMCSHCWFDAAEASGSGSSYAIRLDGWVVGRTSGP